jgi:hypothetical protein
MRATADGCVGRNGAQKYDPELVKDALRPVVFEEVRVDVDDEMRVLLTNLKEMVAAEKAAKSGKKGKKGKKGNRAPFLYPVSPQTQTLQHCHSRSGLRSDTPLRTRTTVRSPRKPYQLSQL